MVALSGALMPGPMLTVTITQSAKRGFIASALIVLGHALLELLLVIGLLLGLGRFLGERWATGTVAIFGGFMLLWMGWGMIRDAGRGKVKLGIAEDKGNTEKPARVSDNLVLTGALVSMSNPYWILWWATIGLGGLTYFKGQMSNPFVAILAFFTGHISGDILWYLVVGGAVTTGKKLLNESVYKVIIQFCGAFLILLGVYFLHQFVSGGLWTSKMSLDWMKHQ